MSMRGLECNSGRHPEGRSPWFLAGNGPDRLFYSQCNRCVTARRRTMETEIRFTPESLSTPDVRADPYPAYRQLRPQSPFLFPYLPAGIAPGLNEPVMAWALM